jgi:predicted flap endonuclease-1-like 5' DNA nuclease
MSTTNILLLAGVLLFVACFVYIFYATKGFVRRRDARLEAERAAREGTAIPPAQPAPPPAAKAAPAAPAPAAEPPAGTASPFLPSPDGEPDDLSRIKGIGPKLSARLAELGVFHYTQIAGWTPEQLAAVDAQLGNFQGRPERDQWQSQARLLASGDVKAYERAHGKLEQPSGGPDGTPNQAQGGPAA